MCQWQTLRKFCQVIAAKFTHVGVWKCIVKSADRSRKIVSVLRSYYLRNRHPKLANIPLAPKFLWRILRYINCIGNFILSRPRHCNATCPWKYGIKETALKELVFVVETQANITEEETKIHRLVNWANLCKISLSLLLIFSYLWHQHRLQVTWNILEITVA